MGNNTNKSANPTKKELRELQKKKRRRMKATVTTLSIILAVGLFVVILFAAGAFDYQPQATYHISIAIQNYGSVHVELYGNDAPETVEHFLSLANDGYYNGKTVFKLFEDLMYMGNENASDTEQGIKGEFSDNGFANKVSHKRGTLSMARGDSSDSAYGQFFIVRKDSPELDGKYAAFGKITSGMDVIDDIFKMLETDENGMIEKDRQPIITSISGHDSHSH